MRGLPASVSITMRAGARQGENCIGRRRVGRLDETPRPVRAVALSAAFALAPALALAVALALALAPALGHADVAAAAGLVPLPPHPAEVTWPTESWPEAPFPHDVDQAAFDEAEAQLFESTGRTGVPDTRALLIVRDGRIVFERYGEGFDASSRFQSWSMAKSITNAFVALLVRDGQLELDAPALVEAWQGDGDPRGAITLRHLLQMRSGLDNDDGFGADDMTDSFVSRLLFGPGSSSPAAYASDVPLAHPVGEHWAYSTGSSTLLAAIAGEAVGDGAPDTLAFLRARLFEPLGMHSAQPEFAPSGEFIGGAFMHANARDWARFGYLYLRDGTWAGERLLPEGWVDFSRTPSPASNNGIHGAHFWLNGEPGPEQWVVLPGAPESAFMAEGAMFQMVAIIPTKDLVVVRLGESQGKDHKVLREDLARLIAAFPERAGAAPDTGAER